MSQPPRPLEHFNEHYQIILLYDDSCFFVPIDLLNFDPEEKDVENDNSTPAELGKLCRLLQLLLQAASLKMESVEVSLQREFETQLSMTEPVIKNAMNLMMLTADQVIVDCEKQSKKMLASCLPHSRSGPLPSLVIDKIAEFLIEDEDVWTKENCKFENLPSHVGKRYQWTNQVYNELAEIYNKIKHFVTNKHSCQLDLSVFEVKRTMRRLLDGKLFG